MVIIIVVEQLSRPYKLQSLTAERYTLIGKRMVL